MPVCLTLKQPNYFKVLSLQHLDYFWFFFLLRNVVLKTTESWGVHFHMTVNSSTWLIQRSEGFFTLNTHTDIWLVVLSLLGFFPPSLKVFLAAWFHFSVQLRRNETDNTLDSVLLIITQLWSNKVLFKKLSVRLVLFCFYRWIALRGCQLICQEIWPKEEPLPIY